MSNAARIVAKTIILILLLAFLTVGATGYFLLRSSGTQEVQDVIIPRGATIAQVAHILESQNIVEHPQIFKVLLRFTRGAKRVRAGEFRFRKNMRAIDALFVLYNDEPIVHQVTIPEGWNARQIAEAIQRAELGSSEKFLKLAMSPETAKHYKLNLPTMEGFLFPDTYGFSKIDGEERILEIMVKRFFQMLDKDYKANAEAKGFTLEQMITLASIIEKETGVAEERPLVSSVFHNRLKKKMRLQSDPTTIYGIPNFNGNITKADLQKYTPYNTYTIPGLPPGPIASPGTPSIMAALNPATTPYYYFVSNNHGSHLFSETYGQHARRVNSTQKIPFARRIGKVGH